jgi:hypothetical protein
MKFSERHRRLVFSLPIRFEVFNASRVFWSFCSRLADFDFSVRAASVPLRAGNGRGWFASRRPASPQSFGCEGGFGSVLHGKRHTEVSG